MRGEYFTESNEANLNIYGVKWYSQVYTIGTVGLKYPFFLEFLKLKLYRVGTPGTATVSIRATSGGVPTGSDLASGTINGNTLTTSTAGLWYKIKMNKRLAQANGGIYAIVVCAPSGDVNNRLLWRDQSGTNSYTGGTMCYSGDSGSSWSAYSWDDFTFELYGMFIEGSDFATLTDIFKSNFTGNPDFNVTRNALSLGDRDDATGWYAKNYADTTIKMIVIQKESQNVALRMGYWVSLDALGMTADLVEVYDLIKDNFERIWEVKTVKPIIIGHLAKYFVCDLKEMPLYA